MNRSLGRGYWSLYVTQFLGALNDNWFKNALALLIAFRGESAFGLDPKALIALSGVIYILPFFLFSPIAGQLSDQLVKARIVRAVKAFEIAIAALAVVGFASDDLGILFTALFLLGIHSAAFGPVKYSLLPELLAPTELVRGNALVEVGTFLAILIGTLGAGLCSSLGGALGDTILYAGLIAFAGAGFVASLFVPKLSAASPNLRLNWNLFTEFAHLRTLVRPSPALSNSILAISWFWALGVATLSILPTMTEGMLRGNPQVVTLFLTMFVLGIGLGSIVAARLSRGRVELGLVPIGTFGMSASLLALGLILRPMAMPPETPLADLSAFLGRPGSIALAIAFFTLTTFGGIFTVPLYTLLQTRSESASRARVIAANNILNALFMVGSSVFLIALYHFHFGPAGIFLIYGVLNFAVAFYVYTVVPEFLWRFVCFVVARMLYRVRYQNLASVPSEGAALLICNHITFVDWLVIQGGIGRPIRFVMDYRIFSSKIAGRLFRDAKTIPIASRAEFPEVFDAAFRRISEELRAGELVCLFPEGQITRTGELQEFKKGIDHILASDPVPVIPMALTGLWGSLFSRKEMVMRKKRPARFQKPVYLTCGEPVPATRAAHAGFHQEAHALVLKLQTDARKL